MPKSKSKKRRIEETTAPAVTTDNAQELIYDACREGKLETVQACFDTGAIDLCQANSFGQTILHQAMIGTNNTEIENYNLAVIQLILSKQPPKDNKEDANNAPSLLEMKDPEGRTPIFLAAEFCPTVDVVKVLLDAGANIIDTTDNYGQNILVNCIDPSVAKWIMEQTGLEAPKPPPPPRVDVKLTAKEWKTTQQQIQAAFDQLQQQHEMVCLANAGVTQSDGLSDATEQMTATSKGCVFYTRQDQNQAKKTGEMYVAFSAAKDDDKKQVGQWVVQALQAQGLTVEWPHEDPNQRPRISIKEA